MDFFVLRNKNQVDDFCEKLKSHRLPVKIAMQDVFPVRSVDFNDYLWGFIYTPLSSHTGHTPEDVHEICKRKFNFRWDFVYNPLTKKYEIDLGVGSTTKLDTKTIWDYALAIRAWAELEYHLCLELPSEAWIPALNFEFENNVKVKRL